MDTVDRIFLGLRKIVANTVNSVVNIFRKDVLVESSEVHRSVVIGKGSQVKVGTAIDPASTIGSYVYIGKYCNVTRANIGSYVSIANGVSIGQGEHDITRISTNSLFYESAYDELTKEDLIIEEDVWIGADSIVLRGVVIGRGAVIGANSVVTKSVPRYAVVVGAPARVIKYRFTNDRIASIEKSEWWTYSPTDARLIFKRITENV